MPNGFRQEDLFVFFLCIFLCKTCDLEVGSFWPQGHNFNILGRGLLEDATYQISRLYALWF